MKRLSLLLQLVCVSVCVSVCFHIACCLERTHIFVDTPKSQMGAEAYCREHHANLSTFLTPTDHLKLQSLNYAPTAWIGLGLGPQNWTWTDGSKPTFYNWTRRGGDCAAVTTDGLWVNRFCGNGLPFICQNTSSSSSSSYIPVPVLRTWDEAQRHCEERGHILATFKTASSRCEQCPHSLQWMGLRRQPAGWAWVDEGGGGSLAVLSYSNWRTGWFCALMDSQGGWRDERCFERHMFVCADEQTTRQLSTEALSWEEARRVCQDSDMHLVTVHSATQNAHLRSTFEGDLWIGLANNPWQWPDGSSAEVQYWHTHQPNRNHEEEDICVVMQQGRWNDLPCSWEFPFFCLMRPEERLKVVTAPSRWEEALLHCRGLGGELATIGNHGNQTLTQQVVLAAMTTHVWVGLRFLVGEWLWVSGVRSTYHHWGAVSGQEICPFHHCGAVERSTGLWEPRGCDEELDFLCELP